MNTSSSNANNRLATLAVSLQLLIVEFFEPFGLQTGDKDSNGVIQYNRATSNIYVRERGLSVPKEGASGYDQVDLIEVGLKGLEMPMSYTLRIVVATLMCLVRGNRKAGETAVDRNKRIQGKVQSLIQKAGGSLKLIGGNWTINADRVGDGTDFANMLLACSKLVCTASKLDPDLYISSTVKASIVDETDSAESTKILKDAKAKKGQSKSIKVDKSNVAETVTRIAEFTGPAKTREIAYAMMSNLRRNDPEGFLVVFDKLTVDAQKLNADLLRKQEKEANAKEAANAPAMA